MNPGIGFQPGTSLSRRNNPLFDTKGKDSFEFGLTAETFGLQSLEISICYV
jgi:hypothetical protein